MMNEELKVLLYDELGADYYKQGEWNGYTVYEPVYNQDCYIGFPLVVLEKDGEVRLSTNEEALEYLQYSEQGDGEK